MDYFLDLLFLVILAFLRYTSSPTKLPVAIEVPLSTESEDTIVVPVEMDSGPSIANGDSPTVPGGTNETTNGMTDDAKGAASSVPQRKRIVVVGLGMVAVAFIEKILKLDAENKQYEIVVIGEESHVAYNRVGLTSFFEHRKVEDLYLNPKEWYESQPGVLNHKINTRVTSIDPVSKSITTSAGYDVSYDILILATGSDAVVPSNTPGHDSKGVFVYRNIDDLEKLISFSAMVKGSTGCVVGGGLLGLEAAKAMMDLEQFGSVKLIDKNPWLLSRQLDQDAGRLVLEKVTELGLDVLSCRKIKTINSDENNQTESVTFEDGETMDTTCICFAIGIKPRDELADSAGIKTASRGGFIINKDVETTVPGIYAIGECASWENQTFGLIAPGVEMADVLAFNLCRSALHGHSETQKAFRRPDLSTKLKLLGVNVASFGDFFADRDGPKELPGRSPSQERRGREVKALSYRDPFQAVYKKYIFTSDGKYLLGGMIIGDTADYIKLVGMVKSKKALEIPPSQLILGAKAEGEENPDDLDDDTQICSCHNVTKGDISKAVKDGSCKSLGEVKSCTKAGTGCAGCMPLVQSIFNAEMKAMGAEVSNHLCPHFSYSRVDLFNIIKVKEIKTFPEVMRECGKDPESLGCEVCKPTMASIFASLFNQHVMDKPMHMLQETNDKFLANIQRNGTFSVIPRVPGGEITPDKLIAIGTIAKKYNLYCKITGGQRIDMFGARKQDLVAIWTELVEAGMESGHAYAKSLRTIKSCVGTTWCRFGVGDSVGMAIRLEERYKSIRAPHKIKSGVSGCIRECAEAQNKDFGLIATETGYNIFVAGNGGSKPRHSELLIKDCPVERVIPVLDRYLMFYIRTADRLQRTARWMENLPGGIKYLKEVILDDKLGICDQLENEMQDLVKTYFCEWTEVVKDEERRKQFQQFANTSEASETIEIINERSQSRPTYWPKASVKYDFRNHRWSNLAWQPIIEASYFSNATSSTPVSAAVKRGDTQLAIFKVRGKYYATQQMCPHKRAFVLSDGLIGEDPDDGTEEGKEKKKMWVSCPYHKRNFTLEGNAPGGCANDEEVSIATFEVEERSDGWVYLKLPSVAELDALLGTERWKVKKEESEDPFKEMDKKTNNKGRKATKPTEVLNGGGSPTEKKISGLEW